MSAKHLYRNFQNHIEVIQSIWQREATFKEICADYENVCTWLYCQSRSEGRSDNDCDIAREIIRKLEYEITQVLKSAGF